MPSIYDDFQEEIRNAILNKTITSCSRWAEKRRIMGNPFPGPYSFRTHPWVRELHDSKAVWNVSMKSAQAGFTEVGINIALYTIDVLKKNVLYVLPTLGDASDFSKSRFNTALRMSPYLKKVFTDANNVSLKMAGNTALYIRGSRGDSNLKSLPVALLVLDELDEMDQSQIELAIQRLKGQPEKKIWYISTPTSPLHGVSLEYAKSTQEHFYFKCPGCDRFDEFIFPDSIKICGEDLNDPECYKSYHQCTQCQYRYHHFTDADGILKQDEKLEVLGKTGFWKPTTQGLDDERRGFGINQLYSYTVSAPEIVIEYFKAQNNPYSNQEFHKSVLGVPFVSEQSQVTDDMIAAAIREYHCKQLSIKPGQHRMITMGLDQGKWCYYIIAEWFYPELCIDLNTFAQCRVLDMGKFYEEDWDTAPDRLMHEWQVRACMVDSDPNIQEARRFARRFPGFVWLNRYRQGRIGKELTIEDDETYAPIVTVDRTNWLDVSLGRFFAKTIEIPKDSPHIFGEHIKNLVRMYDEDQYGNPIAIYKSYGADHFGHSLNYAEIALPIAASIVSNKNVSRFL